MVITTKFRKDDDMTQKNYDVLKTVGLFKDINFNDLEAVLKCLKAEIKFFSRNEVILLAGNKPRHVGIALAGQLHITQEDFHGNRTLLAAVNPGEIFAEALCCAGVSQSPVTVTAETDATIMLMDFLRILHTCSKACSFHTKLIENMLGLIANKNLFLQNRMEIVSLKSIRAKVMRYLESLAPKQGRNITIPFNREALADYLCVERSALSHELAKMRKDGLIEYKKNAFTLHAGK